MKTYRVEVTQTIDVTVDEGKFTEDFMREFREGFFAFTDLADHVRHLAQLGARGVIDGSPDEFVEGYGRLGEMGISLEVQPGIDFAVEPQDTPR